MQEPSMLQPGTFDELMSMWSAIENDQSLDKLAWSTSYGMLPYVDTGIDETDDLNTFYSGVEA